MFLFYSTNFEQAFEMFKIQNFGQQQQKCVNQSKGWNTSLGFGQMCRQKWKLTTSELNDSDKRKSETSCGPRVACPAPMPRSGAHGFRPWQGVAAACKARAGGRVLRCRSRRPARGGNGRTGRKLAALDQQYGLQIDSAGLGTGGSPSVNIKLIINVLFNRWLDLL